MPRITPSLAKGATRDQINAYYRRYRRLNLEAMRAYGRKRMKTYRAMKRREALKRQAKSAS